MRSTCSPLVRLGASLALDAGRRRLLVRVGCVLGGVGVLVPNAAEPCRAQPFPRLTCYLGRRAELLLAGLKPASPIGKKLKF